jgi:hypothetical protein
MPETQNRTATFFGDGDVRAALSFQLCNQFFGDGTKAVFGVDQLDLFIDFALNGRIDATDQQLLGSVPCVTSFRERNEG